jgi:hypothetical protein
MGPGGITGGAGQPGPSGGEAPSGPRQAPSPGWPAGSPGWQGPVRAHRDDGAVRVPAVAEGRAWPQAWAAGGPPRFSPAGDAGGPERVIVIGRSTGVQVGRDNEQFSAYQVTLPHATLGSGQALSETLLSPDTPWSRDVFSHDARPDLSGTASHGARSSGSGIVESPRGDTLVIFRDSRGVQVGDRNVQHNEFRIKVMDVTVRTDHVGMTRERQQCIEQLRDNPGDQAAARRLARDVGQAAQAELAADLTARIEQATGAPQINRSSGHFHDLVGRQVGGPGNHASVRVDVRVAKFDTRALARSLRETAARLAPPPARTEPGTTSPGDSTSRVPPPSPAGPGGW